MKQFSTFLLILGLALFLSACAIPGGEGNESLRVFTDTVHPTTGQPANTAKEFESIVDRSKGMAFPGVLETFFKDDNYTYTFGAPISEYVIVKYTDGTEEPVKDALVGGKIKITDLDRFGIHYYKNRLHNE